MVLRRNDQRRRRHNAGEDVYTQQVVDGISSHGPAMRRAGE
jgi:hypothetical protein